METAGVILATIPLIVTALDKYVETLGTIRLFRKDKYRRYLERYSALLDAQQASLVNGLELALGMNVSKEKIGDLWTDPALQSKLQVKMGRDYDVFMSMLKAADHTLQDLKSSLENEISMPPDMEQTRIMREIKKAKKILSKRKYDTLFDDLNTSINLLNGLADQSYQRQRHREAAEKSQCVIMRSSAASIHKALLREEVWRCSCRDLHSIRFIIEADFDAKAASDIVYRIAVATLNDPVEALYNWQDIEIEVTRGMVEADQIAQMCSAVAATGAMNGQRKRVGSLSEGDYSHKVFIAGSNVGKLEYRSLEDIIMSSTLAPWIPGFYFRKKDRLSLATRLAWGVLQFHGNWLPKDWRTSDILFMKDSEGAKWQASFQRPYLLWNIIHEGVTAQAISSVITSQTLFPLGLALIELSLCRSISALAKPEDENPEMAVSLLKTANRSLDAVGNESGERYATVVRRCLHWSETRKTDPDDEEFQTAFYRLVFLPLLINLKVFEED
ncbi:hypothetical protein BJX63DRAFT_415868 [Aspergillus granulosus]|uniref:DUF7580 domain-containing protein n=1 Tax=Aspergillus granulosus TaxID=176169 RepID=A0ABR4GSR7_9EURO